MKFNQSRLLVVGGAILGSIAGIAIAVAQVEPGPSGEIPPLFGPDNPAPSTDATYQQSSQELWARSFDVDQLFVRTAGLPPACREECRIDDSPEALAHLFEVTCNSVDKIQFDALYPDAGTEMAALSKEVQQDCADVLARITKEGQPDPKEAGWRDAATAVHSTLNRKLEAARPAIESQGAEDHE
jgi:hypothetical protein